MRFERFDGELVEHLWARSSRVERIERRLRSRRSISRIEGLNYRQDVARQQPRAFYHLSGDVTTRQDRKGPVDFLDEQA